MGIGRLGFEIWADFSSPRTHWARAVMVISSLCHIPTFSACSLRLLEQCCVLTQGLAQEGSHKQKLFPQSHYFFFPALRFTPMLLGDSTEFQNAM